MRIQKIISPSLCTAFLILHGCGATEADDRTQSTANNSVQGDDGNGGGLFATTSSSPPATYEPLPVSGAPAPSGGQVPPGWSPGPTGTGLLCAPGYVANTGFPGNGQAACVPAPLPSFPPQMGPANGRQIMCPAAPPQPSLLLQLCAAGETGGNLGGSTCPSPITSPTNEPGQNAINCCPSGFGAIYAAEVANYNAWAGCFGAMGCSPSGGVTILNGPLPAGCSNTTITSN